jgi:hypothetical protein
MAAKNDNGVGYLQGVLNDEPKAERAKAVRDSDEKEGKQREKKPALLDKEFHFGWAKRLPDRKLRLHM